MNSYFALTDTPGRRRPPLFRVFERKHSRGWSACGGLTM
jgi:hypothetical protein